METDLIFVKTVIDLNIKQYLPLAIFILCSVRGIGQEGACICVLDNIDDDDFYRTVELKDSSATSSLLIELDRRIDKACRLKSNNWKAYKSVKENDIDEASFYLAEGQKVLKESRCSGRLLAQHLRIKGELFFRQDELDSAVVSYIRQIEIEEEIEDYSALPVTYKNLGVIFSRLGEHDKSFGYTRVAYRLASNIESQYKLATHLGGIALAYAMRSQRLDNDQLLMDSAKIIANQTIKIAKQEQNISAFILGVQVLEADAFFKKDYRRAIEYCNMMLTEMKQNPKVFRRQMASIYRVKSDNYLELDMLEAASQNIDSAIYHGEMFGNKYSLLAVYEKKHDILRAQNKYQEALEYNKVWRSLKDSLAQANNLAKITELELKYEKVQNEKKIQELSQEKKISSLRVRSLLLAAAFLLTLIPFMAGYFRQRILKSRNTILETEQRLNRARMNPHLLFNSLASLQGLALKESGQSAVALYISKYAQIMRSTLESTFNDMTTLEEELEYLDTYLSVQQEISAHSFEYSIDAGIELSSTEIQLPSMIIQPFIENAIEHGFKGLEKKGQLDISFQIQNEMLVVKITDNGRGMSDKSVKNPKYPSRATQIVKDRLYLLNKKYQSKASYDIQSNSGGGLTVCINLPLLEHS